jgi:hypothetical protein
MSANWHVKAARLAAQNPHWPWSRVCSELAKRRRRVSLPPKRPTPEEYAAAQEKLKLF